MLKETDGNGVGRLVEATGATPMVNNSFSMLRYGGDEEEGERAKDTEMSKLSNN